MNDERKARLLAIFSVISPLLIIALWLLLMMNQGQGIGFLALIPFIVVSLVFVVGIGSPLSIILGLRALRYAKKLDQSKKFISVTATIGIILGIAEILSFFLLLYPS